MHRAIPLSYSLRSVFQRRTRTLLTVVVMALVVLAVTVMLSLVSGIQRTLVETGGSSFESEVWVDVNDLWNDANRAIYSGLRVKVAPGSDPRALVERVAADARWALEAKPEIDYYREQADSANFLFRLTLALGV